MLKYRKSRITDINNIATLVTNLLGTCNLNNHESIMDNNIESISKTIDNYYVCEVDTKIVGACGISDIKDDDYNLGLKKIKEILYLVVDKNFQNQGIGTRLLNMCINNQDCDIIYEAWGDNGEYVNSKFLLEKLGFKIHKDLGKTYYKDNGYCPLCVNKDRRCYSCLAQIWIKRR